jgi:hypothetical protein
MTISLTSYRNFHVDQQLTPVVLNEADPELEVLSLSLTGQANGTYRYEISHAWNQPTGTYMEQRADVQGDGGPLSIRTESAGGNSTSHGSSIFTVTDGTIEIHVYFQFPIQGGTANGTYLGGSLVIERILET